MQELQKQIANATDADKCFDIIYQAYCNYDNLETLTEVIDKGLWENKDRDLVLKTLLNVYTEEELADAIYSWENDFTVAFAIEITKEQEKIVKDFYNENILYIFENYTTSSNKRKLKNLITNLRSMLNLLIFKNNTTFKEDYNERLEKLYSLCIFINNVEYENKKDTK